MKVWSQAQHYSIYLHSYSQYTYIGVWVCVSEWPEQLMPPHKFAPHNVHFPYLMWLNLFSFLLALWTTEHTVINYFIMFRHFPRYFCHFPGSQWLKNSLRVGRGIVFFFLWYKCVCMRARRMPKTLFIYLVTLECLNLFELPNGKPQLL